MNHDDFHREMWNVNAQMNLDDDLRAVKHSRGGHTHRSGIPISTGAAVVIFLVLVALIAGMLMLITNKEEEKRNAYSFSPPTAGTTVTQAYTVDWET